MGGSEDISFLNFIYESKVVPTRANFVFENALTPVFIAPFPKLKHCIRGGAIVSPVFLQTSALTSLHTVILNAVGEVKRCSASSQGQISSVLAK